MRCLHCGKKISLLRKLTDDEFCSNAHRLAFQRQQEALAFSRLTESGSRLAPRAPAEPEAPKRISSEVAARITPDPAGPLPEAGRIVNRRVLHIPPLAPLVDSPPPNKPFSPSRLLAGGFQVPGIVSTMTAGRSAEASEAPNLGPLPVALVSEAPALPHSMLAAEAPVVEPPPPALAENQVALPGFLAMGGGKLPPPLAFTSGPIVFVGPKQPGRIAAGLAPAGFGKPGRARKKKQAAPPLSECLQILHAVRPLDVAGVHPAPAGMPAPLQPPASASLSRLARVLEAEEAAAALRLAGPVADRGITESGHRFVARELSGYLRLKAEPGAASPALPAPAKNWGAEAGWSTGTVAYDTLPANELLRVSAPKLGPLAAPAQPGLGSLTLPAIAGEPGLGAAGLTPVAPGLPANRLAACSAMVAAALPPVTHLEMPVTALGVEQVKESLACGAVLEESSAALDAEAAERAPAPVLERLLPVHGVRPIAAPALAAIVIEQSRPLFANGPAEMQPVLRSSGLLLDQADGSGPRHVPRLEKKRSRFRLPSLPGLPRMPRWGRVWTHAPADLKWVSFAIPAVLILVIYSLVPTPPMKKAEVADTALAASPSAGTVLGSRVSTLQKVIMDRAAIRLVDDFRSGLGAWDGDAGWARTWQYDAASFISPGKLALYSPTSGMRDYSLSFLAQIDRRSLNWVVRAADVRNYYAVRIVIVRPGPLPEAVVMRYAVINGKAQRPVTLPLPLTIRQDTLFKVRMEVQGDNFTTYVQDQVVDSFTDGRLPAGGVGFFSPQGDRALLRWVSVMHQYDYVGRLCALLAPYTVQAEGRRVE
jgi:hypothetical protein